MTEHHSNRLDALARMLVPVIAGACLCLTSACVQTERAEGRLRFLELKSTIFGNTRQLRVWLPPGYDAAANRRRRYPVLYLNDGQNLFDASTAVFGSREWRVDETATELVTSGSLPPLVIVGIDNAGRDGRAREYLPYPDAFLEPPEPDPQGGRYAEFLADDVLPLIERQFRVVRSREGRGLGGSSYGALVALHAACARPELFSRLLLESPSFYVDDDHIFRDVAAAASLPDRVYLGVGTNELGLDGCPEHEGNREAVQGVTRMADVLRQAGPRDDEGLLVAVEPCATHDEHAWARRLPAALRFLFGPGSARE